MIRNLRPLLAVACLAASAYTWAQSPAGQVSLHIDAPKLARALIQFAQQSGMQLIYPAGDKIVDLPARPLSGTYTPRAGLEELLKGTGLRFEYLDPRTIAIIDPNAKQGPGTRGQRTGPANGAGNANPEAVPAADKETASNERTAAAGSTLTSDSGPASAQSPEQSQTQAASELQQVTVTGSRVITNGNDSPTPVTVVTAEQMLAVQPTSLSDQLNDLPQLQGSQSQATAGAGTRNGAAAYLTLRDAGDARTLVLYDGRRVNPTTSEESHASDVDINIIPQMLIERVDIVTGGVAAVYGSDAVTGVVNFITDTHFNGLKFKASQGESTYHDDKQQDYGVAAGENLFGGRGHIEFSYEYRYDPGILNQLSRPFDINPPGYAGNGTTVPYTKTYDIRTSNQSFNGLITSGPLSGLEFNQNGILSPFVNGTATGVTNQQIGGDGGWNNLSSLKASLNSNQLFGRFDYDLAGNIHAYLEVAGTSMKDKDVFTPSVLSLNIGYNNPFLASIQQPYQGLLAAQAAKTPTGSFGFTRTLDDLPQLIQTETRYYMAIGDLSGAIGNYKWDIGLEHSESEVDVTNTGNVNMGNLLAAANAVVNSTTGKISCNASLTNAAYANCVPINLFGPTSISASALNYINGDTGSDAQSLFNDFTGSITGSPIDIWAGPVKMAISGEWRKLDYDLVSSTTPSDLVDCTGIQFSCTQGTTLQWLGNTLYNQIPVSQAVSEVAYETDIPLVKDEPFIKALNLNGAVRQAHYDNYGFGETTTFNATPWKIGVDWHVNDDVTLRATRSRDIRAPNLNNLYSLGTTNRTSFFDILTNTTAVVPVVSKGNPNLVPEVGNTSTAGFVWRPHFIPRFSFSVDAYQIKIGKAILGISGNSTQVQQLCIASNGNSPLCNLYVRPFPISNTASANFPTEVLSQTENIASVDTYGADFEVNYAAKVLGNPLSVRALLSWQPHLVYNSGPAGIADIAGTTGSTLPTGAPSSSPLLKMTDLVSYAVTPDFTVSVMERWRGAMLANSNNTLLYSSGGVVPEIWYTNLNFSYTLHGAIGQTELYFNIQNLTNAFLAGYPVPPGDDPYGRYYTLGLRYRH